MMNNDEQIFKDYTLKIKNKLQYIENAKVISEDINNFIILMNWCFLKKNNFFCSNFNKRNIFYVCKGYNQLKTNILSPELFEQIQNIFDEIDANNLKMLKFIIYQYIEKYDMLINDNSHTELCKKVTRDSMQNCIQYINIAISRK